MSFTGSVATGEKVGAFGSIDKGNLRYPLELGKMRTLCFLSRPALRSTRYCGSEARAGLGRDVSWLLRLSRLEGRLVYFVGHGRY